MKLNQLEEFRLKQTLTPYINTVFTYFNGKLNPNCLAKLNVNLNHIESKFANVLFNVVNLYDVNIIKHNMKLTDDDDIFINNIKKDIIINIIHELSHIEQDIDYIRYHNDKQYAVQKECENNYNTYKYIYENLNTINSNLNVKFDKRDIEHSFLNVFGKYNTYKTLSLFEYYVSCLKVVMNNDTNKDMILDKLNNLSTNKDIIINIHNKEFHLKRDLCVNTDSRTFNNMIECYTHNTSSASVSEYYEDDYLIYIKSKLFMYCNFRI